MDLEQIRELVLLESGRLDLGVKTLGGELGPKPLIDSYVRAGTQWLDLQQDNLGTETEHREFLAAGEWQLRVKHCRSAQAVYVANDDEGWTKLARRSYEWILKEYGSLGATDQGASLYWSPEPLQRSPDQLIPEFGPLYQGIVVMPPIDSTREFRVLGTFHSKPLEQDEDENWWSVNYPHVLGLATRWAIASVDRNREGMRDYESAMAPFLQGVDKDLSAIDQAQSLIMTG